jgi:hypothetical protein
MPRSLNPVHLPELASASNPPSDTTAVHGLAHGWAQRGAAGDTRRLYDVVTGRVASNLTSTTTTLADMTGLALPVVAGGHYYYEWSGTYSSSSTASFLAAGVNGPSTGASGVAANVHIHVGAGADWWDNGCLTSFGTSRTTGFISAANTPIVWRIHGYCHIGASGGDVVPQFARNSGSGTITIQAGAWGWLWRLG